MACVCVCGCWALCECMCVMGCVTVGEFMRNGMDLNGVYSSVRHFVNVATENG